MEVVRDVFEEWLESLHLKKSLYEARTNWIFTSIETHVSEVIPRARALFFEWNVSLF